MLDNSDNKTNERNNTVISIILIIIIANLSHAKKCYWSYLNYFIWGKCYRQKNSQHSHHITVHLLELPTYHKTRIWQYTQRKWVTAQQCHLQNKSQRFEKHTFHPAKKCKTLVMTTTWLNNNSAVITIWLW